MKRKIIKKENILKFDAVPNYIYPAITVVIHGRDTLKLKGNKLMLKRGNKRSKTIDLRLVKKVIFYDGRFPDAKLEAALKNYGIPCIIRSDASEYPTAKIFRDKLKNLNLKDKFVVDTAVSKVIAEALSNIVIMKLLPGFNIDDWKIRKFVDAILSNISSLLFRYMQSDIETKNIMAYEGNTKRLFWEYLRFLSSKYKVPYLTARVVSRYIGPKFKGATRSPFHATLNFLYYLLTQKARTLLKKAGFAYSDAGPGILHRRDGYYLSKDDGFLFDFIDMFRPILIHLNYFLWESGVVKLKKDITAFNVPDLGRIYYPNENGKYKLRKWFDDAMKLHSFSKYGIRTIGEIIQLSSEDLRSWLIQKAKYPIFIYLPTKEIAHLLFNLTRPLEKAFFKLKTWRVINNILKAAMKTNFDFETSFADMTLSCIL